jgi:hypothetical protein
MDAHQTRVFLKLDAVPGIRTLTLNGRRLAQCNPRTSAYEILVEELRERNTLVLEIELVDPQDDVAASAPEWGFVSLLFRPRQRPTRSPG